MLDIIFISYDELNADQNYKKLKDRFPLAKRVHHVKGIANAHFLAAKRSNTNFFYVVDGDSEIMDSFNFDYKPAEWDAKYVHIWHALNPALGIDYGYGGIKLFSKSFFKENSKLQLDFSTTLTADIKIINEVASVTHFNADPIRAFRGAFREAFKLSQTINNSKIDIDVRDEAKVRLEMWKHPLPHCRNRDSVMSGVEQGIAASNKCETLNDALFINDVDGFTVFDHLLKPQNYLDHKLDPAPHESNPMKPELFFTTRLSSILYDPYVKKHLSLEELRDAISDGQLLSKNWLVETLLNLVNNGVIETKPNESKKILILGGWIGTLALMINVREMPFEITSVDLDTRANTIAEKLNYDFKFGTIAADMYDVDYSPYDIIINTSSEHIPNISAWRKKIPSGKVVIVQNNNFLEGAGHISNVKNSEELNFIMNLSDMYYEGTRRFKQYDRYMLIGKS
jgi:hypothetical protein